MSNPEVSVLIPVYNAEKYLTACLRSILADPDPSIEVIVLNDGSTDSSPEIMRRIARTDFRVRVENNPGNLGIVASRQRLIDLAATEYVVPFDADDLMLPGRLARQKNFLARNVDAVAVYGKTLAWSPAANHGCYYTGRPFSNFLILSGNPLGHGSVMMRRQAVSDVGGYIPVRRIDGVPLNVSEDYFLFLRIAQYGTLCFVPEFTYIYRLHDSQITGNKTPFEQAAVGLKQWFKENNAPLLETLLRGAEVDQKSASVALQLQALGFLTMLVPGAGGDALPFIRRAVALAGDNDAGPLIAEAEYWLGRREWNAAATAAQNLLDRFSTESLIALSARKLQSAISRGSSGEVIDAAMVEAEIHRLEPLALGADNEIMALLRLAADLDMTAKDI